MKAKYQHIFDISITLFTILSTCAEKFASLDSLSRHFSLTSLLIFVISVILLKFLPKTCVPPAKIAFLLTYCVTFCELFSEEASNDPFLLINFTIFANLLLFDEKNPVFCSAFPVLTLFLAVFLQKSSTIYRSSACLLSFCLVLAKTLNKLQEKTEQSVKETAKTEENLYKKLLFERRDLGFARIELKFVREVAETCVFSRKLNFFSKMLNFRKTPSNFTVSHCSSSKVWDFPSKLCIKDANYAMKKRFGSDLLEKPASLFEFLDAIPAEALEIQNHAGFLTVASHKSIDLEAPRSRVCGILHEVLQKLARTSAKTVESSRTVKIKLRESAGKQFEDVQKLELVPCAGGSVLLLISFCENRAGNCLQEEELGDVCKELRRSLEMKDKLFASISHDMRSPLSGIVFYIKTAKDCENLVLRNEKLDIALMNANLLLMLVNDFLDFSLFANHKKLSSIPKKFTLHTLLEEVYSMIIMEATNKNINIVFELSNVSENLAFISDERRLKQVLVNLFTNAIKFTFQGYVKLRISQVLTHENLLKFEVFDTGKGVRAEVLPKLMTPFATFDLPNQKINGGGIGLGLFICKTLAGVLGPESNLFIYSEEGKGTKVGFLAYIMKENHEKIGEQKIRFEEFFDKELEYYMEENVLQSDIREVLVKNRNIPIDGFFQKSLKFVRKNSEKKHSLTFMKTLGSNNGNISSEGYKKSVTTAISNSNNLCNLMNNLNLNNSNNISPKQNSNHSNSNLSSNLNNQNNPNNPNNPNNSNINNTLNNFNMINSSYHTGESLKKILTNNDVATNNSGKSHRKNKLIAIQPSNTIDEEFKRAVSLANDQHFVLIVDDHSYILIMLYDMIKSYKEKSFVIEKANNGLTAVQMFSVRNAPNSFENPYEIIFMDNEMPVMRGYDAARVIKGKILKEGYKDVKIIGCSGDSVDIHNKGEELLGIDDILVKPYSTEMMHECLKKYL